MIVLRKLWDNIYSGFKDLLTFDFFNKSERDKYEAHGLFDRSEHMRQLHKEGRYKGTSKIGEWNSSEERKERMKEIREKNSKDKTSKGYGSEYKMRVDNKNLLLSQYKGDPGYLYYLDFPTMKSVKIGISKNWEFRTSYQLVSKKSEIPEKVLLVVSGLMEDLAELEFNALLDFQDYTRLNSNGTRYTEFLDDKVKKDLYDYILGWTKNKPNLKLTIKNSL